MEEEANAGWFRIRGMAIKQYQSYTLTDNWFEERAPSLRGVMPDYGDRCFTTQASLDYPAQRKEGNSRPEKLAKLVRMVVGGRELLIICLFWLRDISLFL